MLPVAKVLTLAKQSYQTLMIAKENYNLLTSVKDSLTKTAVVDKTENEAWKVANIAALMLSNPDFDGDLEAAVKLSTQLLNLSRKSIMENNK